MMHYIYSEPVFNGLYTSGSTIAFCGATDRYNASFAGTISRDLVTCPDCLEDITA